jgi:betaine reductase
MARKWFPRIKLPKFDKVPPAPPIKDLSKAVIALVTDGGLYPAGNPDRIEASGATKFGQYSIDQVDSLSSEQYEVNHNGYNNAFVEADPNRLVPVDVARELEKEGYIGKLFPYYFATTGVVTTLANSKRIGESIARILKENQVDGVILTST